MAPPLDPITWLQVSKIEFEYRWGGYRTTKVSRHSHVQSHWLDMAEVVAIVMDAESGLMRPYSLDFSALVTAPKVPFHQVSLVAIRISCQTVYASAFPQPVAGINVSVKMGCVVVAFYRLRGREIAILAIGYAEKAINLPHTYTLPFL
jgi:hypothetical protein